MHTHTRCVQDWLLSQTSLSWTEREREGEREGGREEVERVKSFMVPVQR